MSATLDIAGPKRVVWSHLAALKRPAARTRSPILTQQCVRQTVVARCRLTMPILRSLGWFAARRSATCVRARGHESQALASLVMPRQARRSPVLQDRVAWPSGHDHPAVWEALSPSSPAPPPPLRPPLACPPARPVFRLSPSSLIRPRPQSEGNGPLPSTESRGGHPGPAARVPHVSGPTCAQM